MVSRTLEILPPVTDAGLYIASLKSWDDKYGFNPAQFKSKLTVISLPEAPTPMTDAEMLHQAAGTRLWKGFACGGGQARWRLENEYSVFFDDHKGTWEWAGGQIVSMQYHYLYRALVEIIERGQVRFEGSLAGAQAFIDGVATRVDPEQYLLDENALGFERLAVVAGTDSETGQQRISHASHAMLQAYMNSEPIRLDPAGN